MRDAFGKLRGIKMGKLTTNRVTGQILRTHVVFEENVATYKIWKQHKNWKA